MNEDNKNPYIQIYKFMISEMNLKGNALLIYACIYGFNSTGKEFCGGRKYLSEWTGGTLPNIQSCLNNLIKRGYIKKEKVHGKTIYSVSVMQDKETLLLQTKNFTHEVKKLYSESKETLLPSNNISKNIYNTLYYNNVRLPTKENIESYCNEKEINIDTELFYNYYAARGWCINGTKIKDWKALIEVWGKNPKNIKRECTFNTSEWFKNKIKKQREESNDK